MPYYPTIAEDLKAAEDILARGKLTDVTWDADLDVETRAAISRAQGGTIYGADTYAAYKLLESFVKEIPRLNAELLAMHEEATQYETELNRLKANPMTRMHNLVDALKYCDRCGESPTETEGEPNIYCEKCDKAMRAELENYQLLIALMGVDDYKPAVRAWKALQDDRDFWDKKAGEEHVRAEDAERHVAALSVQCKQLEDDREYNATLVTERDHQVAAIDAANDAVQDWVNANHSLVPEGLDQLLSELDVVINGK